MGKRHLENRVRCLWEGKAVGKIVTTPRPAGTFKKRFLAEDEEGRVFNFAEVPFLKECHLFVFIYNNSTDYYVKYFYIKYFLCTKFSTCII